MKNKINIRTGLLFSLVLILSLFSGCKKLLDKRPDSSLTRNDFFRTESDANAALIGVYDALQASVSQFWLWGESRGDLVASTDLTNGYPYFQLFDNTTLAMMKWDLPYQLIARANVVITDVPRIVGLDNNFSQEESNAVVGQARYLRALAFFYLVRTFNEVPLVLEAPNSDDVNYRPAKTSAENVLKQIEEDLMFAETSVPVSFGANKEIRGRVTKGGVHALQADVYLWQAKYVEAAAAAKKVIDNTALYSLVESDNWFNIFSVKNSTESIFEVQFDYTLNELNNLLNTSGGYAVNRSLIGYFESEQDLVRGNNGTYSANGQFWKYAGLNRELLRRPTQDPNFIVYRLPDVMLMRAEALAHGSFEDKTEAIRLINLIRARALLGLVDLDGNIGTAPIVDIILKERAMELGMEGKRWFDLLRIARNDERPELLVDLILSSRTVGERSTIRPRIVDSRAWFLPIHLDELNANPNLVQNPYYK
ncbi:MAG: RagB/SusD family nutrient uptake outer membrane protein [Pedobacter sp.]